MKDVSYMDVIKSDDRFYFQFLLNFKKIFQ